MMKPEVSIPAGLATAALVYGIYGRGLPPMVDVRAAEADDNHVAAIRRQNAWMAAGVVGAVSLLAKDPTIFVIGGAMVIALDWSTRHANAVNPLIGGVDRVLRRNEQGEPTQAADDAAYGPTVAAA